MLQTAYWRAPHLAAQIHCQTRGLKIAYCPLDVGAPTSDFSRNQVLVDLQIVIGPYFDHSRTGPWV